MTILFAAPARVLPSRPRLWCFAEAAAGHLQNVVGNDVRIDVGLALYMHESMNRVVGRSCHGDLLGFFELVLIDLWSR
jgi:hypothetical protein